MITLHPINIDNPFERALLFSYRADTSHVNDSAMSFPFVPEEHLQFVRKRVEQNPCNVCFVMRNDEIVGMFESGPAKKQPEIGYINLLYVRPDIRGQGIGQDILKLVEKHLASTGFAEARLTSIEAMKQNTRFYSKAGWNIIGPREDRPGAVLWEKKLTHA